MDSKHDDDMWAPEVYDDASVSSLFERGPLLGEGAFGKVYAARPVGTGGDFSLVIKNIHTPNTELERRKLNQEVYAMRMLTELMTTDDQAPENRFPKLVHAHRQGRDCQLVMERIQGGELFEYLSNSGRYAESDAAEGFKRVVEAVRHMHAHGIYHRDLKPENLLLRSKGAVRDILICDFGLCQIRKCTVETCTSRFCNRKHGYRDPECLSPSIPLGPLGTVAYMSPEVLTTNRYEPMDGDVPALLHPRYYEPYTKADEWALGVILYILVHGIPPFYDDGQLTLKQAIISMSWQFWDDYYPVSGLVKALIRSIFVSEGARRPDCTTILEHAWFENPPHTSRADLAKRLAAFNRSRQVAARFSKSVDRLRLVQHLRLRAAGKDLRKSGLTAAVVATLRSTFMQASGGTLTVDSDAFCQVLARAGFGYMAEEYGADLFDAFDTNHDGVVDFGEFLAGAALMTAQGEDTIKWLFKAYSGNDSLFVDEEGFAKVVYSLNPAAFANPDADAGVEERMGRAMDLYNLCVEESTELVQFEVFMREAKSHPELVKGIFDPATGSCFGQELVRRAADTESGSDQRRPGRAPPTLVRSDVGGGAASGDGDSSDSKVASAAGNAGNAGNAGEGESAGASAGSGTAVAPVTPAPTPVPTPAPAPAPTPTQSASPWLYFGLGAVVAAAAVTAVMARRR